MAADFVEAGSIIGTKRDFTMEELAADAEAVSEGQKNWGADQPLAIPNQSQWMWGAEGGKVVLIGIIKASMFCRQDDPKNDPAKVQP